MNLAMTIVVPIIQPGPDRRTEAGLFCRNVNELLGRKRFVKSFTDTMRLAWFDGSVTLKL
jgi:hypothetical protein